MSSYFLVPRRPYHWFNIIPPQYHLTSWSLDAPAIDSVLHAGIYIGSDLSVFLPHLFSSVSWVCVDV